MSIKPSESQRVDLFPTVRSAEGEDQRLLSFTSDLVRQKAIAYIDSHLSSTELRPSSVAAGVNVSRAVLYRAFQVDGGVASFMHERRLCKARSMLEKRADEPGVINRVAFAHGYSSASRFSRLFASHFAEAPSQFVRRIRSRRHGADTAGMHGEHSRMIGNEERLAT